MSARTLVISPNWIGDAVMAQPLLALLKQAHPERPIDVLAPPAVAAVWRAMAQVDSVLETPFRHGPLQLGERWKYGRLLGKKGYAQAYVLPNTLKYALIPLFAGIPERVGYKGESRYGLINRMHHDDVPPRPMVVFYAALAGAPGAALRSDVPKPALRVAQEAVDAVCARVGIDRTRALIMFAPGAAFGSAKQWPARHFAALAATIMAQYPGAQIGLLGSPNEKPACDAIMALAGGAGMFNLAGVTRLDEAVALLAAADVAVANDSGLMHVAAALGIAVVGLFGSTDPDHTPPMSELSRVLSLRLPCAPCAKRECPLGHHDCMEKMEAPMVWQTLQPMLPAR
jgi:heptosyltransferase-2